MNKVGNYHQRGFSLLEVLVVLAVFSLLSIVSTTVILLSVRGSRKSDTSSRVRQNVDHAISTIERQMRNASSVTTCPNTNPNVLNYLDENGTPASFSCFANPEDGYIASGSAKITADEVIVENCSITCVPDADGSAPPYIDISITARDKNSTGVESSLFSASTQIYLRTY
ncbi:MAG: prepilin-type N-terminal cleavage/methylation domain-containing protein [Patescibacteria group bacterium]